ncbi:MAG: hypothetical protein ACUZ8E_06120 [Candidatus Anammoxibacter sp.]
MIITIDSNVLLSVFSKDSLYQKASSALYKYNAHEYIINECIYLELGVYFERLDILDESLETIEVGLVKDDQKNYDEILNTWILYLKKKRFRCSNCRKVIKPICPECHNTQPFRQRVLADFIIGGFASLNSKGIITFDPTYYRNYFPQLKIFE